MDLEQRLRAHVERLARAPRLPGTDEHRGAAEHVRGHLEAAGFVVEEVGFTHDGVRGMNLLTRPFPDGAELPLVIWGAHYDSKPLTPGADDNASGVAALLELAAWLGPQLRTGVFTRRVQLVAYDMEEFGFGGSLAHSRQLHRDGVALAGMVSLEMLGYTDQRPGSQQLPPHLAGRYPDVGNFIGVCGNESSRALLEAVAGAMKGVPGLPVESLAVPGRGEVIPEVRLSDHSPFWDLGYPALMITDTSFFRNPHYHRPSDTAETLDYAFLARVTAGVFRAARQMLFQ